MLGFILFFFFAAILMGWHIIPYILLISLRKRLFDPVNARKVHKGIVPRLGGIAFVPIQAVLLTLSVVYLYKYAPQVLNEDITSWMPMFLGLTSGLLMLFIMGMMDDLIGVNYKAKFAIQFIAACIFPLSGLWINDLYGILFITSIPEWIGYPLTVFVVVLIVNATNLIDGLDGLCSGLMMVGTFTLGALFFYNGAWIHAVFAFISAGMLVPFFYFNVQGKTKKKRRIFMGDTGSLTLGYTISFLALSYTMNNPDIKHFSEGAIVVAFSMVLVPVLDVARVVFFRFWHKQPLFQPDRNHIHHKFLRLGFSHHASMLLILLLALCFNVFNIVGVELISNNIILFLDIVIWISFHLWLDWLQKRRPIPIAVPINKEKEKEQNQNKTNITS